MASSQITVKVCEFCGKEYKDDDRYGYCLNHEYPVRPKLKQITRDKQRVGGTFKIVDWFSTRASAGLTIEHGETGEQFNVYMSDLFKYLDGKELGTLTLEEIKKGQAYGWMVLDNA
ncbi:hypothetical protein P4V86_03225 [Brevibacillus laterosporus]|uniref:hypothetical protein n=1 Tax=Brevibacillus laterosporus TaxID=1465 RepID=UPI0003610498|nr:hypothetical protein [Brevibacillus laterosporus]ATO48535.1 hypothetical protein BrL25_05060 [Brevibacillus laterosporus DSM 25]MED2002369.1 hypothetical protein [Brevibacillus laterosporus]